MQLAKTTGSAVTSKPRRIRWLGVARDSWVQYGTALIIAILVVAPLIPIVVQSFLAGAIYEQSWIFTWSNYIRLFTEANFGMIILNTLLFASLSAVLALVIGIATAIAVTRLNIPGRALIGHIVLWPMFISPLVLAFGWIIVYGPAGYASVVIEEIIGVTPWYLYSLPGMAVTEAVALAPFVFLYCSSALKQADTSLENAARMCGAKPASVVRYITVPLLRPPIFYSGILVFAIAVETLSIPLLYGRTEGIELFASFLYIEGLVSTTPDHGLLGAASVITLLFMAILVTLQIRALRNANRFVAVRGKAPRKGTLTLGRSRWIVFALIVAYLIFGVGLPLVAIILRSFTQFLTPLISPLRVMTLDNYVSLFGFATYVNAIVNSIIVALIGGLVTSIIATLAVLVVRKSGKRISKPLEYMTLVPLAIPGVVLGLGFFYVFAYLTPISAISGTIYGLMIVFGVRALPIAFGAVAPIVMQIADELDQAARQIGADWVQTYMRLLTKLFIPGFFVSFVLLFVQMVKEFTPAVFLVTSNNQVIGTAMLSVWINGDTSSVAVFSVIQIAIVAIFVFVASKIFGTKIHA